MHDKNLGFLKKHFEHENYNNLLVFGPPGSGKKTLIEKSLNIKSTTNKSFNNLQYKQTSNHYFLHSDHINRHKKDFNNFINDIVSSNINMVCHKNIIISNSHKIHNNIFISLQKFIETSMYTTRFIFITNSCSGIMKVLMSKCNFIRIPYETEINYKQFITEQCKLYNTPYNDDFLKYKNIGTLIDAILLDSLGETYIEPISQFCCEVNKNISNFTVVKNLLHAIIKMGFNPSIIMSEYARTCNDPNIIPIIADHEQKSCNGYRELIYLESLFYNIHILKK